MRDFPNKKDGYSAVAILTLAQIFAFIDRQIPAMLVEPIKQDFGLSDSEIALLGRSCFFNILCGNGTANWFCS